MRSHPQLDGVRQSMELLKSDWFLGFVPFFSHLHRLVRVGTSDSQSKNVPIANLIRPANTNYQLAGRGRIGGLKMELLFPRREIVCSSRATYGFAEMMSLAFLKLSY
jgi:hypothetical protein